MIKNGKGGGNTKTGLVFEGKTDLATFLNSQEGYQVTDGVVFYNDKKVARIFKKHGFYRYAQPLVEMGVSFTELAIKATATAVTNKIKAVKDEKNIEKIRNTLLFQEFLKL